MARRKKPASPFFFPAVMDTMKPFLRFAGWHDGRINGCYPAKSQPQEAEISTGTDVLTLRHSIPTKMADGQYYVGVTPFSVLHPR
jgi:hypothetical protein